MGRFFKILTILTNIVTAVVFAVLVWFLWQRFSKPGHTPTLIATEDRLRAGAQLGTGNLLLAKDRHTLLVALSKGCHYCEQSAPFYRHVSRLNKVAKVVAMFPEPVPDAAKYVEHLNLKTDAIATTDYAQLGVSGTPTMILVDSKGKIADVWVGQLGPEDQTEVLKRLGATEEEARIPSSANLGDPANGTDAVAKKTYTYEQVKAMQRNHVPFVLVDVRDRDECAKAHLPGAISMPLDEFETRGPHEIHASDMVVVDCSYCSPCELKLRRSGLPSLCTVSIKVLNELGYHNLALTYDDKVATQSEFASNKAGQDGRRQKVSR